MSIIILYAWEFSHICNTWWNCPWFLFSVHCLDLETLPLGSAHSLKLWLGLHKTNISWVSIKDQPPEIAAAPHLVSDGAPQMCFQKWLHHWGRSGRPSTVALIMLIPSAIDRSRVLSSAQKAIFSDECSLQNVFFLPQESDDVQLLSP